MLVNADQNWENYVVSKESDSGLFIYLFTFKGYSQIS